MNRLSLVWSPLTYLMEQSASWEANQFSSSLETHWISWNRKVHYYIHSCPSPFNLYQFHFLFWAYHSWGIKQGLGIVTCNIEDSVVIGLVCVFLEVFLTALSFRGTYCPTFRACAPFMQVPCVPECPLEGLGNIMHLCEWGTSSEGGAKICRVGCIALSLDFFPVWGEHSVNHGWICIGEGVCQVCGHRPLLHQNAMGLAQEWTPPR